MTRYYVYEQEKEMPGGQDFKAYLDFNTTAVVSIDMHEGHLSQRPDCPCPAPRGRNIVNAVDAFHVEARRFGVPVIHVVSTLRQSGIDDTAGLPAAWRLTMPEYFGPIPGAARHGIEGSEWTRLHTYVDPRDEIVNTKRRLSAFYPTDLDFLLRQMNIRTVVFTGVNNDCCILNSAFDASNRNYRVIVLKDVSAGTDEYLEAAGRTIVSLFLGMVMDSTELVSAWEANMKMST
ncbi:TPA: cysteine hydrolase [Klebsiella pneumoniae]|nr:cysteine hydrolase [Klebsiella pneumoniae]